MPGDVSLFLGGDVMLGRGIDQILPHPSDPRIYERGATSAKTYVELAEAANGPICRPVGFSYVWGEALAVLERERPDARIINLETAISRLGAPWPDKGINYRMHPHNIPCLRAAGIDCCVLANNHVLDWGREGLLETLAALDDAGIRHAGAGSDAKDAAAPAILPYPGGRIVIHGLAETGSGIPRSWAATACPGITLLPDLDEAPARRLAARSAAARRPGDIVIASIHWGSNWGYFIPPQQRRFARALLDGGFDLVHGHSAHHAKGIEIHNGKLILYGCGDFLNDYEGISGMERFRTDLTLMYLPRLDGRSGRLRGLRLVVFQIRNFRLFRAARQDVAWLDAALRRASPEPGIAFSLRNDQALELNLPG